MAHSIKILFILAFFVTANDINAQGNAQIKFDTLQHDFGEVREGDQAEKTFYFTNTGTIPLKIKEVKTTCSCTASDYTRDTIGPGQRGFMKVNFDTQNKNGEYVKGVNVFSNAGESNLLIYCKVIGDPNKPINLESPPSPPRHQGHKH